MRYLIKIPLYVLAAGAFLACAEVDNGDIESSQPKSNITTTESIPGKIEGDFKKNATNNQRLVGSKNSAVKENFLDVPVGALAIDTVISMQDGANGDPNSLPADLGITDTAILGGSSPVLLGSTALLATTQPFTLNIPLPLATSASGTKLNLAGKDSSKVGVLYLVKTATGNKVGLYVLGSTDLVGTIVRYKDSRFGWFRIVLLSQAASSVEKDTLREPGAKES